MDNREDCWDECKDRPDCEIEDEDFGFFENEDCASFTCPQPAAPQRASLDQASCRLLRRSWMPVEIKVVPAVGEVPPGGTVEFAVFATGAADVGGYEIKCATSGLLSGSASVVPSIQDRRDALFNGAESVSAVDPVGRRVLAVALSGGVSPARAAYLGTFTGRLSDDASGTLEVGLATGPEELIVADPDGRPYRVNVTPGTVRITPPSRGP